MKCGQKKYDVEDFLELMERERPNEHAQLVALLDRTAKHGVGWNEHKVQRLHGPAAKHICEFKTRGEVRVFWFFDDTAKNRIICTHGFVARGRHHHANDIARAQERRHLYYQQLKEGQ